MTLRPLSDVTPADWFVQADASEWIKITLGPPGFEAYARVLFDIDRDAPGEADAEAKVGRELRAVLARHTGTPGDCYFCLWDGWGGFEGGPQDTGLRWAVMPGRYSEADHAEARRLTTEAMLGDHAPAFDPAFIHGPKVTVPDRQFYLFAGPLEEEVDWGAADYSPGLARHYRAGPALMWPADHAWFQAADVDPDWIGIGGSSALIAELLANPALDVVPAIYTSYGSDQL